MPSAKRLTLMKKLANAPASVRQRFIQKLGQAEEKKPAAKPKPKPKANEQQGQEQGGDQGQVLQLLMKAYNDEVNASAVYNAFACAATGAHREYLAEFWQKEALEELGHALTVGTKVAAMGGQVGASQLKPADTRTNQSMIQQATQMETEAIGTYVQLAQAAEAAGMHGIKVVAEEILADEQNHMDEFVLMGKDIEHVNANDALGQQAAQQFQSMTGGLGAARQSFPPASQMTQPGAANAAPPAPPQPGPGMAPQQPPMVGQ